MRLMKVLAIVARFKWTHIDYLHALAERVDLSVAWSGEGHTGAAERAAHEGLPLEPIGRIGEVPRDEVERRLAALVEARPPDLVHVMYYHHEELVLMSREVVSDRAVVVCETRDTLTTLTGAQRGSPEWNLEAAALRASDAQVLLTAATRAYLESAHGLDLEGDVDHRAAHVRATKRRSARGEALGARRASTHRTRRHGARSAGGRTVVWRHHPPARRPGPRRPQPLPRAGRDLTRAVPAPRSRAPRLPRRADGSVPLGIAPLGPDIAVRLDGRLPRARGRASQRIGHARHRAHDEGRRQAGSTAGYPWSARPTTRASSS